MVSVRTQLPEAISERASRPVPPTKADPYRRHDQRIPPGSHDMDEVLGTHSLINEYTHVARRTEDPQVTGRILFRAGQGRRRPRCLLTVCASLRMAMTSQIWLRASQSWPFAPVGIASA